MQSQLENVHAVANGFSDHAAKVYHWTPRRHGRRGVRDADTFRKFALTRQTTMQEPRPDVEQLIGPAAEAE